MSLLPIQETDLPFDILAFGNKELEFSAKPFLDEICFELTPPNSPSQKDTTPCIDDVPPLIKAEDMGISASPVKMLDVSPVEEMPWDHLLPCTKENDFLDLFTEFNRPLTPPAESMSNSPCQSPMMTPCPSRSTSPLFFDDLDIASNCEPECDVPINFNDDFDLSHSLFDFCGVQLENNDVLDVSNVSDEPPLKKPKRKIKASPKPKKSKSKAASRSISTTKPPEGMSKRDAHNISERLRRQALKESFEALRKVVPSIAGSSRVHTGQILKEAVELIKKLQAEDRALMSAKKDLTHQNNRLQSALKAGRY